MRSSVGGHCASGWINRQKNGTQRYSKLFSTPFKVIYGRWCSDNFLQSYLSIVHISFRAPCSRGMLPISRPIRLIRQIKCVQCRILWLLKPITLDKQASTESCMKLLHYTGDYSHHQCITALNQQQKEEKSHLGLPSGLSDKSKVPFSNGHEPDPTSWGQVVSSLIL